MKPFGVFIVFLIFMMGGSVPAKAAFLYCNKTQWAIEASFGYRENGVWVSQGWWQIQPEQCARVSNKPIAQRFYFYYARALMMKDEKRVKVWGGKYQFCVDNKAFKIEGDGKCEERNYKTEGFREIDVGGKQSDYTLTFEDPY